VQQSNALHQGWFHEQVGFFPYKFCIGSELLPAKPTLKIQTVHTQDRSGDGEIDTSPDPGTNLRRPSLSDIRQAKTSG
jgi:hypothetical protein